MRRFTGTYDGVEHVLFDHEDGLLECPSNLRDILTDPDGTVPMGQALEERLRLLFGDSLIVTDYAPGETPPDAARP